MKQNTSPKGGKSVFRRWKIFHTTRPLLSWGIIGGIVVLLFLRSIICLIKNGFKHFVKMLRRMEPQAIGIFFGVLFLFFTEVADGIGRRLSSIGISIGINTEVFIKTLEEISELGIPLMFILTILAYFSDSRQSNLPIS